MPDAIEIEEISKLKIQLKYIYNAVFENPVTKICIG